MPVPISNVTRRVVYAPSGTGGAGPYAFTFEILANTDIAVFKDDVLLTLTTHYTVTINANGTGSVTITAAGLALAPANPTQYAIVGNRTIARSTDFTTGGDFFANTLNDEIDQQTIFAQQNAEGLSRALQAPQTDPTSINMTLPRRADRANKFLAFNSVGDPVPGETPVELTSVYNNIGYIQTIGADLAGTGFSYDLGSVSDAATGVPAATPDGHIVAVYNALDDIAALQDDTANIATVAGIAADVTTVAGISANVTAVAADATDIGAVAGSIANVNTVATNIASVNTAASDIAKIIDVANDLNEAVSEIDVVANNIANVNTAGTNIANINTVAGISGNVTTVAGISSAVSTVSGISANVTTVSGISANVTTVAGISSAVTTVAGDSADIQLLADNIGTIASKANAGANSDITSMTAVTSVTSTGALTLASGGSNQNITIDPSGTGKVSIPSDLEVTGTLDCGSIV